MTDDTGIRDRMTKLAKQLLRRTLNGQISWNETDNENEFIYSASDSSVAIQNNNTRSITGRYTLTVRNWRGTIVQQLQSALRESDFVEIQEDWNEVLLDLYEAARRNALNIEGMLDDLITELGDDGGAEPPIEKSE